MALPLHFAYDAAPFVGEGEMGILGQPNTDHGVMGVDADRVVSNMFDQQRHHPLHHHASRILNWRNHSFISYFFDINSTSAGEDENFFDDGTGNSTSLQPAMDVTVRGVFTAFCLNGVVCVLCLISYEILRRVLPEVYSGNQMKSVSVRHSVMPLSPMTSASIPKWTYRILKLPWATVREKAGLDAYMFLRFINLCLRITMVSAFWGLVILGPVFATGDGGALGWYHLSMANVGQANWRIWVPTAFMYLTTAYVIWAMRQEYKHYLDLRMDFLGRGELSKRDVNPQHHYSVIVEEIPKELRSDRALFDYFNGLFPGKVHSACVVLNLPELESLKAKRLQVTRRLEKANAYLQETGRRPTHIVGQPRLMCCGIETKLARPSCGRYCRCLCCAKPSIVWDENSDRPPERGDVADSITYYTRELAEMNEKMVSLQREKTMLAELGNQEVTASGWIDRVFEVATAAAAFVVDASVHADSAHSLVTAAAPETTEVATTPPRLEAAPHSSKKVTAKKYGSVENNSPLLSPERQHPTVEGTSDRDGLDMALNPSTSTSSGERRSIFPSQSTSKSIMTSPSKTRSIEDNGSKDPFSFDTKHLRLIEEDYLNGAMFFDADPIRSRGSSSKKRGFFEKLLGTFGCDFALVMWNYVNRRLDTVVDNVFGTTMSSTGFVTFFDLASVTCAASAPLTNTPDVLEVAVAPEPRDIIWKNAQIEKKFNESRESTANVLLGFGAIIWSIPLAAIQAFATADSLARIPGLGWILTMGGGKLTNFINGYLPVVALLGLILLLPLIFEWVGVSYEKRKTQSDVQHSIVGRYFYYQLANIYVSVTAGSILDSLFDIIDKPSKIFEILGKSLPTVVGYFISLLITKILAGLPMVMLRFGALSKMLFYKTCFRENKLTQRELDEVYKDQCLWYGWEYPTQLLVIVICFTYTCISPIILPFGAVYFLGALIVYKKQVLYVYTPTYESGGILFPTACDRTLMGLICGQITFIGYCILREAHFQPIVLFPLPFFTVHMMRKLRETYGQPGNRLSLERAMDTDSLGLNVSERFDKDAYRQPVLAEKAAVPLPYRRGQRDSVQTMESAFLQEDAARAELAEPEEHNREQAFA